MKVADTAKLHQWDVEHNSTHLPYETSTCAPGIGDWTGIAKKSPIKPSKSTETHFVKLPWTSNRNPRPSPCLTDTSEPGLSSSKVNNSGKWFPKALLATDESEWRFENDAKIPVCVNSSLPIVKDIIIQITMTNRSCRDYNRRTSRWGSRNVS